MGDSNKSRTSNICLLLGYISYQLYDFITFLETRFPLGGVQIPSKNALFKKPAFFKNAKTLIPPLVN